MSSDDQIRELKTMILDLKVEIIGLKKEVHALREAATSTEVVVIEQNEAALTTEQMLKTLQRRGLHNDS
ncbi:hypothetical protein IWQ49_006382 [Labrenzia sp. EL_126]|nr:hypothetical protein [Labrenzia sp. EL_126]